VEARVRWEAQALAETQAAVVPPAQQAAAAARAAGPAAGAALEIATPAAQRELRVVRIRESKLAAPIPAASMLLTKVRMRRRARMPSP